MKTGLLLVDLQNDYFPGGKMELVGINKAVENAQQLLEYFRSSQLPTFHIQHFFEVDSGVGFFIRDTEGVEIHESIKPLSGELIIPKNYPNGFRETSLLNELKKAEIEDLVICGAMSHMCIDATTRAAADLGFNCVVVHDACATKDLQFGDKIISAQDVHGAFMNALGFAYANVVNFSEFKESSQKNP
ncbi:MAG: cysteine hydrolase [Symploca sp. SIO1C4]|uniref:Cysteine hydrolase n=1 Tax=Symploca sp. SIO1C4 TaxID=2607765 RepID=A0A6B3N4Q0_9CYAN|nr:cysteine hydrolase [Symploca sp. SIO1C4]NET07929.1 cysteine hydrolase [Symploca sp. SIO2B6]